MNDRVNPSRIDAELAGILAKYFGEKLSRRKPARPGAEPTDGKADDRDESDGNVGAMIGEEQAEQKR